METGQPIKTYPVKALHRISRCQTGHRHLLSNQAAQSHSNRHPMLTRRGSPSIGKVTHSTENKRENISPDTHLRLLITPVPTGQNQYNPVGKKANTHPGVIKSAYVP